MLVSGVKKKDTGKKNIIIISTDLEFELIFVDYISSETDAKNNIASINEAEQAIIDEVVAIPAPTWFTVSKWEKTQNFQSWQRSFLF